MLHTTGELFLSPIGLSMVTKLSPKKMAGTAMGAWFLSFAIANLLGGQIAALTGGGHGGSNDSKEGDFTSETTVEEALATVGNGDLASWPTFYEIPENVQVPIKEKKDVEVAKNITLGKFLNIKEWILLRNSIEQDISLSQFLANKNDQPQIESVEAWLKDENWEYLRQRYAELIAVDYSKGEKERELSVSDWNYFQGGIDELDSETLNSPLSVALDIQVDKVQANRLSNYINVFTTLGYVLLGIALIIIIANKPLQKLMHGVK